jgi:zinc/manganese transport system ATP-binding protein
VTAIALDNVTISLGSRRILSDVTLDIRQGEFIGMLGANGAGKTTLMRAILGLIPVSAGSIKVLGNPARPGNRAVGYMPQASAAVSARLNGRDFVVAAANGHRWGRPFPGHDDYRDADRALELVGATALAKRPLTELSGGERQRLLLAQALLGGPKILLLDEPLISLDPSRQSAVIDLVRRLQRDLGIAVLFSAHELNPLLGALDRVLYLGNGQAALGPVEEVITGPVLSRLYGSPIEVVRVNGRIFVMSGLYEMERGEHLHDDGHDHHHGHHHA